MATKHVNGRYDGADLLEMPPVGVTVRLVVSAEDAIEFKMPSADAEQLRDRLNMLLPLQP